MPKRFFILLIAFVALMAEGVSAQNQNLRKISNNGEVYHSDAEQLSLRIETGKVWVNGNLIPKKKLPEGLRTLDPNFFYTTAVYGIREISFNLQGKDYLVKSDKIVELPPRNSEDIGAAGNVNSQAAMQEYYSNLKREAPSLFYSMTREAVLTEQARNLIYQFQFAKGDQREDIQSELHGILEQLFEINERNRQLEILELQQMIDVARQEIEIRKENKAMIIDNTMKELLGK